MILCCSPRSLANSLSLSAILSTVQSSFFGVCCCLGVVCTAEPGAAGAARREAESRGELPDPCLLDVFVLSAERMFAVGEVVLDEGPLSCLLLRGVELAVRPPSPSAPFDPLPALLRDEGERPVRLSECCRVGVDSFVLFPMLCAVGVAPFDLELASRRVEAGSSSLLRALSGVRVGPSGTSADKVGAGAEEGDWLLVAATMLGLGEPGRGFEVCGGAFREGEPSTDPSSLGPLDLVRSMTSFVRYAGIERHVRLSIRNGFILDMAMAIAEDGATRSLGSRRRPNRRRDSSRVVVLKDASDWQHRAWQ